MVRFPVSGLSSVVWLYPAVGGIPALSCLSLAILPFLGLVYHLRQSITTLGGPWLLAAGALPLNSSTASASGSCKRGLEGPVWGVPHMGRWVDGPVPSSCTFPANPPQSNPTRFHLQPMPSFFSVSTVRNTGEWGSMAGHELASDGE